MSDQEITDFVDQILKDLKTVAEDVHWCEYRAVMRDILYASRGLQAPTVWPHSEPGQV